MRIDVYESKIKRFVTGTTSVTLKQLQYAFKDNPEWDDLSVKGSVLQRLVTCEEFQDEEYEKEINIHALLIWGLMNCSGDKKMKTRVLYDVLQDAL